METYGNSPDIWRDQNRDSTLGPWNLDPWADFGHLHLRQTQQNNRLCMARWAHFFWAHILVSSGPSLRQISGGKVGLMGQTTSILVPWVSKRSKNLWKIRIVQTCHVWLLEGILINHHKPAPNVAETCLFCHCASHWGWFLGIYGTNRPTNLMLLIACSQ